VHSLCAVIHSVEIVSRQRELAVRRFAGINAVEDAPRHVG
jgi:hypothetical protein